MVNEKPVLAIVGLGVAGAKLARQAAASGLYNVVSIDPKDFVEVPFAGVRTAVLGEGAYVDRAVLPYSSVPGGLGKFVQGKVKAVKRNSLELESGEVINFDYAVICTGSAYPGGVVSPSVLTAKERKAELKASADRIKDAKSIVVVGGGPVGIEVVGEIVTNYANKQISLVHNGEQLLDGKEPKMHNYLEAAMKRHNVQVILGDKAGQWDEAAHILHTVNGQKLPADLVIWAVGSKPNTQPFIEGGELASAVDSTGRVKVDEYLRVEGAPHIFAVGDINNTPQTKLGYLAGQQADLTLRNLAKTVYGSTRLGKWVAPMQPKGAMFVSFGPQDGAGHISGWVLTGWIVKMMKSKDLFVWKFRKELGLKK